MISRCLCRKSIFLANCISLSFLFALGCGKDKSKDDESKPISPNQNLRGGACYLKGVYGEETLTSQCQNFDASLSTNQTAIFKDACTKGGFELNLSALHTDEPCDKSESKAHCQKAASGSVLASTRYYYLGDFEQYKKNCESEGGAWSEDKPL